VDKDHNALSLSQDEACAIYMHASIFNINFLTNTIMFKFFPIFFVFLMLSCNKESDKSNCFDDSLPPRNEHKVTIDQGLWGDVWFWSGDFMPPGQGDICQVKRKVLVYELTHIDDVEQIGNSAFYTTINTNLVASVKSDKDGFFQIELEPGNYSLFIEEDNKLYSNHFSNEWNVNPVEIEVGTVSEIRLDITHEAVY